jgi:hypothetical protein
MILSCSSGLICRTLSSSCESPGGGIAMRLVLLVGCVSLTACAAFVTVKFRSLNRKFATFPPIYGTAPRER